MKDFFLLGRGELFLTFIDVASSFMSLPPSAHTQRGSCTDNKHSHKRIQSGERRAIEHGDWQVTYLMILFRSVDVNVAFRLAMTKMGY